MTQTARSSWIYSLDDYRQIFALNEQELHKRILDYPGGINSVNAQCHALGYPLISGDPLYQLTPQAIAGHADEVLQSLIKNNPLAEKEVRQQWRQNLEQFLADYELGKRQGRYIDISQPQLPAGEEFFDILLCTDLIFNAEIMAQLCKMAAEIRVFPLPNEKSEIESQLGPTMLAFQQRNFGVEIRAVNYPQRQGATAMLRIWAKECEVNSR